MSANEIEPIMHTLIGLLNNSVDSLCELKIIILSHALEEKKTRNQRKYRKSIVKVVVYLRVWS